MKVTEIPMVVGALRTVLKKTGAPRNQRKNRDHPDNSIIRID